MSQTPIHTEKQILLSNQPFQGLAGYIFTTIGILMLIVVVILYKSFGTTPIFDFDQLNLNLPYLIPGLAGALFALIGSLMLLTRKIKKRKILYVLRNGRLKEGKVISNVQNFHYTSNNIPQRKVIFQSGSETYLYTFFGEEWAQLFTLHTVMKFRHDNKGRAYPDPKFLSELLSSIPKVEQNMDESFAEGAKKLIKAAEMMLDCGDKAAALSFYDAAYAFQTDKVTRDKIITLANELNDLEMLKKHSKSL